MAEEQVQAPTQAPAEPVQEAPATPVQEAAPSVETPEGQSPAPPEAPPKEAEPVAEAVPTPEEYVLPEGMPENLREFAHNNKLSQAQLDASLKQFAEYSIGLRNAEAKTLYDLGQAHIKQWGESAPEKLALAKQALKQTDKSGMLTKALKDSPLINHPAILEYFAGLGADLQEGGFMTTERKSSSSGKSWAQALFGETHPSSEG